MRYSLLTKYINLVTPPARVQVSEKAHVSSPTAVIEIDENPEQSRTKLNQEGFASSLVLNSDIIKLGR